MEIVESGGWCMEMRSQKMTSSAAFSHICSLCTYGSPSVKSQATALTHLYEQLKSSDRKSSLHMQDINIIA